TSRESTVNRNVPRPVQVICRACGPTVPTANARPCSSRHSVATRAGWSVDDHGWSSNTSVSIAGLEVGTGHLAGFCRITHDGGLARAGLEDGSDGAHFAQFGALPGPLWRGLRGDGRTCCSRHVDHVLSAQAQLTAHPDFHVDQV